MKTKKLIELERKRLALMDEARNLVESMRHDMPEAELAESERRHNQVMREFDLNQLDIEEARGANSEEQEHRQRRIPGFGTSAISEGSDFSDNWLSENRSGWVDEKGERIRVLGPNENFSTRGATGLAVGDLVRAQLTGARNDAERRALSEGTNSAGGFTVPTPLASYFIDRLRAKARVIQAGALTVPMDSATFAIARLATDPAVGWRAEGASLASGDPTFEAVKFTAKSLAGIIRVSRELMDDTINLGAMLEQAMLRVMALEIDRAALFGDGSNNTPRGIASTSGINVVTVATNGATATYDHLLDGIYQCSLANVDTVTAAIGHPRTFTTLAKLKDSTGAYLAMPEKLRNLPQLATTAAPINETQGSSSTASSVILGDFTQLLIGMREEINIRISEDVYASTGEIAVLVHARADVQLAHPESFTRVRGLTL